MLETANHLPPLPPPPNSTLVPQGMEVLLASLQAMLGPAIKMAMAPYAAKLDTLKRAAAPITATRTAHYPAPGGAQPAAHVTDSLPTTHGRKGPQPQPNPTPVT